MSGGKQWVIGLGLLLLAFFLWLARDAIPALATTRAVASASVYPIDDGTDAQLQHAIAVAKAGSPVEATFESREHVRMGGSREVTYGLYVTADTPERAKADLAALADAIKAAFPNAEHNLGVSENTSTTGAPTDLSRRLAVGVKAAVVLLLAGAQIVMVVGAYRDGSGLAGMLAAIATGFSLVVFPSGDGGSGARHATPAYTDWTFVLLMLGLTPISLGIGLWLTRGQWLTRRAWHARGGQRRGQG
jgi:hypothetical protein